MVTSIERVATKDPVGSKRKSGSNGNGHFPPSGNRGGGPIPGSGNKGFSPDKYRIGMWVALAAIVMMFTALVSAYIVLASSDGWRSIPFPRQLWLSTAAILGSSFALKNSLGYLKKAENDSFRRWLNFTFVLGLAFLGSQLIAWKQMTGQGLQVANNARALFYVLTGLHGVHVIGGIAALSYLLLRKHALPVEGEAALKRQTVASVVGLYWHFMGALWIFLFLLLLFWG